MIYDSYYWKDKLKYKLREYKKINFNNISEDEEEKNMNKLESFIMESAFIVRKLYDSKKLSDECENDELSVLKYDYNGKTFPNHVNRHHLDKFYNLSNYESIKLKMRKICNFLIHSVCFELSIDEYGCFFNSNQNYKSLLYYMKIDEWVNFIKRVINDGVVESKMKKNDQGEVILHIKSNPEYGKI